MTRSRRPGRPSSSRPTVEVGLLRGPTSAGTATRRRDVHGDERDEGSSYGTTFIESRGYWNEFWDALLDLDEDFFEAYTRFLVGAVEVGPARPEDQGVRLHRGRRRSDAPVRPGDPAAHQAGAWLRRNRGGDHGGARADGDPRHPRVQHRRADPRRGARGGRTADRRRALGAPAGDQGRLHREARLLEPVLGRDADGSTPSSSRPTRSSRRCHG